MVYFNHHVVLTEATQVYIGVLILVLFLLVLAVLYVGLKFHQLSIAVQMQNEMLEEGVRVQARKVEGKNE
jgi:predicted Holliday junction resolvase-like endonuclease